MVELIQSATSSLAQLQRVEGNLDSLSSVQAAQFDSLVVAFSSASITGEDMTGLASLIVSGAVLLKHASSGGGKGMIGGGTTHAILHHWRGRLDG